MPKGQIPWNKNLKGIHLSPKSEFKKGSIPWIKGKKHSEDTKLKLSERRMGTTLSEEIKDKISNTLKGKYVGEKNWNWTGNNISYKGLHNWLFDTFGKANKCENESCLNISNKYEWAKIKGKRYERKRENFRMLCISCHRIYDGAKWNLKYTWPKYKKALNNNL